MAKIILPELGEGVAKATIACWHVKVGDAVKAGDELLEVVTDKATFSVDAPANGKLQVILVEEGKESPVGEVLGIIE
jgi:pyruvate dehydrogenase E2 component (dihydrolipoamide acetyltransferase)